MGGAKAAEPDNVGGGQPSGPPRLRHVTEPINV